MIVGGLTLAVMGLLQTAAQAGILSLKSRSTSGETASRHVELGHILSHIQRHIVRELHCHSGSVPAQRHIATQSNDEDNRNGTPHYCIVTLLTTIEGGLPCIWTDEITHNLLP